MADKPRVKVAGQAHKGDIVQIKTLVSHVMETGLRKDENGQIIPRRIINRFTCEFNGRLVFSCDLGTGIAANPYLQFSARVEESGTFRFNWIDDDGVTITAEESISVS